MILEMIFSTILSLTPAEKNVVNNLQTKLKKEGYDISQYVKDPRFQIYKPEGKQKFVNYADTTQCWYMKADSIEKCADFVKEYYFLLKKAEEKYGPSPEHITSQLQLETNRGQNTGERPVINSLISVYLNRPDRRTEFYKYITDFLELFADTSDNIIYPKEIFEIKGSWAGAYGIAQGMPEAIKKYGKYADGDGDGFFNPMNLPDAIDFMALYLSDHGFKKNPSGAIQRYNGGHPFYGSSIGKHIKELEKIMDKRERIPINKIDYKINPMIVDRDTLKYNQLQNVKMNAIVQKTPLKQSFIKKIIPKRKIWKA